MKKTYIKFSISILLKYSFFAVPKILHLYIYVSAIEQSFGVLNHKKSLERQINQQNNEIRLI
jgi:hypothetical protein